MLDLEAIELIKQLKARYFRFIDTCNVIGLRDQVFTQDALIHFRSPSYDAHVSGWEALEKFYLQSFTNIRFGMHHGHHPEITVMGEHATGIWYLHDIFIRSDERVIYEGSALYEDVYVKVGDDWRIKQSRYDRLLEMVSPLRDDVKLVSRPIR